MSHPAEPNNAPEQAVVATNTPALEKPEDSNKPYTLEELKTLPQLVDARLNLTVDALRENPNKEAIAAEITQRVSHPKVVQLAERAFANVADYAQLNEAKIGHVWERIPTAFQTQLTQLAKEHYGKEYDDQLPSIFVNEFHEFPAEIVQPFIADNANLQRRWTAIVNRVMFFASDSDEPEVPEQLVICNTATSNLEEPAILCKMLFHAVPTDRAVEHLEVLRPLLQKVINELYQALDQAKHPIARKSICEIYTETARQASALMKAQLAAKRVVPTAA